MEISVLPWVIRLVAQNPSIFISLLAFLWEQIMTVWDMGKFITVSTFTSSTISTDSLNANVTLLDDRKTFRIEPMSVLELRVRFPIGKITERLLDEVPERLRGQFPVNEFRALEISLQDGVFVEVDGFGLPFHNPGHVTDDWINKGSVVADSMTFIDILRQRKWHIIVKHPYKYFGRLWEQTMVPAPFTFPYGNEHWFDLTRYETQFKEAVSKGSQFPLSVNFPDVSSMQSAITQSAVQDCLWIAVEVAKIFAKKHPAYFIPAQQDAADSSRFFVIVQMGEKYRKSIGNVWSYVNKDGSLRLALHQDMSPLDTPSLTDHDNWRKYAKSIWNAKIIEKANSIPELKDHPLRDFDLLLLVQRPRDFKESENKKDLQGDVEDALKRLSIKTFPAREVANQEMESWNSVSLLFDSQLSDLERKVKAVNQYTSSSAVAMTADGRFIRRIHEWNVPTASILNLEDRLLSCLMEEISEEDRGRFRQYMGHLPVGFGILTAVSKYLQLSMTFQLLIFGHRALDLAKLLFLPSLHWPWLTASKRSTSQPPLTLRSTTLPSESTCRTRRLLRATMSLYQKANLPFAGGSSSEAFPCGMRLRLLGPSYSDPMLVTLQLQALLSEALLGGDFIYPQPTGC